MTGLPRSGTSLMMQILEKAGVSIHHDGNREKDINNPEGYFELDEVKSIVADNSFLNKSVGKAVKIVCPLPIYIDTKLSYRVIFMRRDIEEILRSQEKMLNKNQTSEREKYRTIYEFHLKKTYRFLKENNIPFVDIHYSDLVTNPENELTKLNALMSNSLDMDKMMTAVKPELYRNRNEEVK